MEEKEEERVISFGFATDANLRAKELVLPVAPPIQKAETITKTVWGLKQIGRK
jgi:hypothetical protein